MVDENSPRYQVVAFHDAQGVALGACCGARRRLLLYFHEAQTSREDVCTCGQLPPAL